MTSLVQMTTGASSDSSRSALREEVTTPPSSMAKSSIFSVVTISRKGGTLQNMWVMDLQKLKNIQQVLTQPVAAARQQACFSDTMSSKTYYLDPVSYDSFGLQLVKFRKNPNFAKSLLTGSKFNHSSTTRDSTLGQRSMM